MYFELRKIDNFDNPVSKDAKVLVTRNQNLRHFCLHMHEVQNVSIDPHTSSRDPVYMWRLHPKPGTLSLFDLTCQHADVHTLFPGLSELRHVCSRFSFLEQLELWFHDDHLPAPEVEQRHHSLLRYLVSPGFSPALSPEDLMASHAF